MPAAAGRRLLLCWLLAQLPLASMEEAGSGEQSSGDALGGSGSGDLPPVLPATHAVTISLVAAGTVESFGLSARLSIAAKFAAQASVSVDAVTVTVAPASVAITVSIAATDASAGTAIEGRLSAVLASASAASTFLAVSIEATPLVSVVSADGCAPGTFDLGAGGACATCPPGYACGFNTTLATLPAARCPVGFYCPTGGGVALAPPVGYACPSAGLSQPLPCAPGTYSSVARDPTSGTAACSVCGAGHECPTSAASAPVACGAGQSLDATAAASGARCAQCAAGSWSNATGAVSGRSCTPCADGYTSQPGARSSGACFADPALGAQCAAGPIGAIAFLGLGAVVGMAVVAIASACLPRLLLRRARVGGTGTRIRAGVAATPPRTAGAVQLAGAASPARAAVNRQ